MWLFYYIEAVVNP